MIGLGTDIIEIERIRRAIQRERFVSHTFTPQEQAWLETKAKNKAESAAGLFCAKEAVAKALGTGFQRGLNLKDIEITHDALGAPQVHQAAGEFPAQHLALSGICHGNGNFTERCTGDNT